MKNKNILVSFVGTNDGVKLLEKKDGAILTVLKNSKFDEVVLIWTSSNKPNIDYDKISQSLFSKIKRKYSKNVRKFYLDIEDVTDHNEIYPKLLDFLRSKLKDSKSKITAAIASGTPSMQACWILIAESGDFPLKLIRSNEPGLGKKPITSVKLGTGLPRIVHLEEENKNLKIINKKLLPIVSLSVSRSEIKIDNLHILFSPMEFCYYRYFLERAKKEEEFLKVKDQVSLPREFSERIIKFYGESYPEYDIDIREHKKKLSDLEYISVTNFRSVRTKVNSKIKSKINNNQVKYYLEISSEGPRRSISYGIHLPKDKIKILK